MHAFLLGSITLGLLSIKKKIYLSNFAEFSTLLYSMGSLVLFDGEFSDINEESNRQL
jgi:hypothetical protein